MQEESGARIYIRGKGSKKDEDSSTETEELHVLIEGSQSQVEAAKREVGVILFNPQEAMKIKTDQLRDLAHSKAQDSAGAGTGGGYGGYGSGGYHGAAAAGGVDGDTGTGHPQSNPSWGYGAPVDPNEKMAVVQCPNNLVGKLIGRGGDTIQRLQAESGARMIVAKENEMKPGDTLRDVVCRGEEKAVASLVRAVEALIQEQLNANDRFGSGIGSGANGNSSPRASGANAGGGSQQARELDHPFIMKLAIPNEKVGLVIGRAGSTIRMIQESSGATIQVPSAADTDNASQRTLTIGGNSPQVLEAAQLSISRTIQPSGSAATGAGGGPGPGPGKSSHSYSLPDACTGLLIGKQGCTIKELQIQTGCRIQVPHQAEPGSNPPIRIVTLLGTDMAISAAIRDIDSIVMTQAKWSGAGAGAGPGPGPTHGYAPQGYGYGYPSSVPPGNNSSGGYGQFEQNPYGGAAKQKNFSNTGTPSIYAPPAGYVMDPQQHAQHSQYHSEQQQQPNAQAPVHVQEAAVEEEEVPSDPTHFYGKFWEYASYYGEDAARSFYGEWSPPVGTFAPASAPAPGDACGSSGIGSGSGNGKSDAVKSESERKTGEEREEAEVDKKNGKGKNEDKEGKEGEEVEESEDDKIARIAWEEYQAQYHSWWLEHGKAAGAPESPPMQQHYE